MVLDTPDYVVDIIVEADERPEGEFCRTGFWDFARELGVVGKSSGNHEVYGGFVMYYDRMERRNILWRIM